MGGGTVPDGNFPGQVRGWPHGESKRPGKYILGAGEIQHGRETEKNPRRGAL